MPIHKKTAFSRRLPDLVTEELAAALMSKTNFEFKESLLHLDFRSIKQIPIDAIRGEN